MLSATMDQKYLVSVEYGAGSLSNTEIGKKTLDMRILSEYSNKSGLKKSGNGCWVSIVA